MLPLTLFLWWQVAEIISVPSLPKDGLLYKIFDYVRVRSKAPDQIVFWIIMALLGASLKDKIVVKWTVKRVFPNLPLLIVAPSGYGKTGAVNACKPIFANCLPNIISEDSTAESALMQFAQSGFEKIATCGLWVVPELADIFGKKKYQEGLIPKITRILDAPKDHEICRKSSEKLTIKGHAVLNWIACSTFQWLSEYVEESMSTGGFLPRLLSLYTESDPKFVPDPICDEQIESYLNLELVKVLKTIKHSYFQVDQNIKDLFFETHQALILGKDSDTQGFTARRDENLLRIYIVLKAFGGITETSEILRVANGCCKWFESNSISLYNRLKNNKSRNLVNSYNEIYHKCVRNFKKNINKELNYTKTCRNLGLKSSELQKVLKDCKEVGLIAWSGLVGEDATFMPLEELIFTEVQI